MSVRQKTPTGHCMFESLHMHFDAIMSIMASQQTPKWNQFSTKETFVPYVAHECLCLSSLK